jgi:hypothetical protein
MIRRISTAHTRRGSAEAPTLLDALTRWQHVRPRLGTLQAAGMVGREIGCCPEIPARAVNWLRLEPTVPIGRLRRTELIQLARSMHRLCQRSRNAGSKVSTSG